MNALKKTLAGLLFGLGVAAFAAPANAVLIVDGSLTLDTDPAVIFQQTAASPCVIGGENCLNGAFPYTVSGSGGGGTNQDLSSPVPIYTVAQITAIVGGSSFTIGIDYNQSNVAQTLTSFEAIYTGGPGGSQLFDIATVLQVNNNGVGFSDFLLSGFVIPAGVTHVQFRAVWFDNDGPDRYFLIGADTPPFVPEPATLGLLGVGLLGLGFALRRRRH